MGMGQGVCSAPALVTPETYGSEATPHKHRYESVSNLQHESWWHKALTRALPERPEQEREREREKVTFDR